MSNINDARDDGGDPLDPTRFDESSDTVEVDEVVVVPAAVEGEYTDGEFPEGRDRHGISPDLAGEYTDGEIPEGGA